MDCKPYIPSRSIEGFEDALTSRQQLAQVRRSLEAAKEAREYWPRGQWDAALSALEREEAALREKIRRSDDAAFGEAVLRPVFENIDTGATAKMIVRRPDAEVDMPHVTEAVGQALRRCVGAGRIEVHADYDVYVVRRGHILDIIPRYE